MGAGQFAGVGAGKGCLVSDAYMTVAELREALADYPDDTNVNILDWPLRREDIEYRAKEGLLLL